MKKIKPIKAWALTSRLDGACIYAYWTFDSRTELADGKMFHREGSNGHFDPKVDHWIRVEIRPLYSKPPKKKGQKYGCNGENPCKHGVNLPTDHPAHFKGRKKSKK